MTVAPKRLQVAEVVFELETMYPLLVAVEPVEVPVASLAAVWAVEELVEPKVGAVGPDFALLPRNSLAAGHVLEVAGPTMVGTEPGPVPGPMGSNWLWAELEVVLGVFGSKEAEVELEFV